MALCLALEGLRRQGMLPALPIREQVAAVSVGVNQGRLLLDLDYEEDSGAAVDANFVGTGKGELIEVQMTGEAGPFPAAQLQGLLALAQEGLSELLKLQEEALAPMAAPVLVMASRNPGKLREMRQILADLDLTLLGLDDFPNLPEIPEVGASFAENAAAKAREVARLTGLPALADDSGLEVEALNGRPGIYSARYAQDRTAACGAHRRRQLAEAFG